MGFVPFRILFVDDSGRNVHGMHGPCAHCIMTCFNHFKSKEARCDQKQPQGGMLTHQLHCWFENVRLLKHPLNVS